MTMRDWVFLTSRLCSAKMEIKRVLDLDLVLTVKSNLVLVKFSQIYIRAHKESGIQ